MSSGLRVVIAHNPVGEEDDPSTSDVLAQVEMVESALAGLGIPSLRLAVEPGRTLEIFRETFREETRRPGSVIFNLIESPPGRPYIHTDSTAVLELAGLPYTGSAPSVLSLTTDKVATRALLASEGLAVAPGGRLDLARLDLDHPAVLDRVPPPWILKPAFEDASVGLEGDPVYTTREAALARGAELARRFPGQPVLVERYLPGRELNVSLLANGETVEVLPVAEILFEGFPEGMSRVVSYEAKWDEGSFACIHTVRCFPDREEDAELLARVREIALAAWRICGLEGYARVDLRLDEHGVPHVLEVNANPCLTADAGFMAAAGKAGLTACEVVRRILGAVKKTPSPALPRFAGEGAPAREGVAIRGDLRAVDREPLEKLIRETGFFNPEEVAVALELIDERLSQGEASHYRFLVAEVDGVAGYACWGPIPGTTASADLYWIVVDPRHQGKGIGAALLKDAEAWMASAGRTRVYVETSTRAQYMGTRRFYLACGYEMAAELADFYAPGDGKAVFLKVL
ncbi:MAG TPA: GNAT family N-acetyltransferase [Thermoanaerobaculia bacterium]|nr:GNAT family N-acetyltransferase [Thermoanaerobaculia bacterium]